MEQLIPIASKLQDVLGALGQTTTLDLPQIVVVGGQSSGKSSVLEAIVGRSFLPRGAGIVTRRPLVLTLYNNSVGGGNGVTSNTISNSNSNSDDISIDSNSNHDPLNDSPHNTMEYGEFLHLPGKKFYSFSAIRHEIIRDTNKLTGTSSGIASQPIHLKIYSPHVLALTLVDLPGIAKVAVGDQPEDIEEQIRAMCLQYISNPNAIILAVTAANTDIANSDALQLAMAKEVDPLGERTVGVLTKLDLMDPGTDCADILMNKVVPLRRGYIGVVNRGQLDVESDASIRDGIKKEDHFFRNHPVYGKCMVNNGNGNGNNNGNGNSGGHTNSHDMGGKLGTMNLARTLNSILMHHIRECLPELKSRIGTMMNDVQLELDELGNGDGNGTYHKANLGGVLLTLLSKFTTNFGSTIEGRGNMMSQTAGTSSHNPMGGGISGMSSNMSHMNMNMNMNTSSMNHSVLSDMNELFGGARISYIFTEIFSASLMSVAPFDGLTDEEIRTTITNANGTRPSLFVPEMSFDILVRRQISRLEQPGIQCVDLVFEELQRIANQCEPGELTRFPNLRERLVEVVGDLLRRAVGPTQLMVGNLVKIELAYINTSHPDFIGGSRAVAQLMRKLEKEKEAKNRRNANGVNGMNGGHGLGHSSSTPLSTSSLNNYIGDDNGNVNNDSSNGGDMNMNMNMNKENSMMNGTGGMGEGNDGGPPLVDGNGGEGGILNFVFGRGKTPVKKSIFGGPATSGHGGMNRRGGTGMGMNGMGMGMQGVGGMHGPPSIVQLPQVPDTMRQTDSPITDREKIEMEIIKSLIESYFNIVRKNFIDMVPKTIMYFLVNHVRDAMQNELVAELYRDNELPSLMKEADDVAQRRKTCVEMKDLLSTALEIVNEVRDFNTFR